MQRVPGTVGALEQRWTPDHHEAHTRRDPRRRVLDVRRRPPDVVAHAPRVVRVDTQVSGSIAKRSPSTETHPGATPVW
jgi:hypothetical protein